MILCCQAKKELQIRSEGFYLLRLSSKSMVSEPCVIFCCDVLNLFPTVFTPRSQCKSLVRMVHYKVHSQGI